MCIYSISYNPILPVYFVAALVPTAIAIGSSFELAPVFFQYALLAPPFFAYVLNLPTQDVPGHVVLVCAPALTSAIFQGVLVPFTGEWY